MKTVLVHLIACMALPSWTVASTVPSVTAPHNEAIAEYVQFLRQPHQTPVDYLLSLFHTYDIVVLCERVHPEITQYDLLYELACDRRFQEQVGHIFTECGSCTLRSFVESFLLDATLTDEQVTEKLRHIYRNYDWEKPAAGPTPTSSCAGFTPSTGHCRKTSASTFIPRIWHFVGRT